MGNEYWILYCDMEWKRWGSKWNEPLPTTAKDGLHLKNVMLCIWWDWRGILYYEFLLENQMINSNKHCSQIDQLKATLDKKLPELVNRKHIILHQDKSRLHDSLMTRQNCYNLFWFICCIHQTLHLQMSIYVHLFWSLLSSLNRKKCQFPESL